MNQINPTSTALTDPNSQPKTPSVGQGDALPIKLPAKVSTGSAEAKPVPSWSEADLAKHADLLRQRDELRKALEKSADRFEFLMAEVQPHLEDSADDIDIQKTLELYDCALGASRHARAALANCQR